MLLLRLLFFAVVVAGAVVAAAFRSLPSTEAAKGSTVSHPPQKRSYYRRTLGAPQLHFSFVPLKGLPGTWAVFRVRRDAPVTKYVGTSPAAERQQRFLAAKHTQLVLLLFLLL